LNSLDYIIFFELAAVIAGCVFYKKYFKSYIKYFTLLLIAVASLELVVWILRYQNIKFENRYIYNIITTIQSLYYLTLYRKVVINKIYRNLVSGFISIFVISIVVNFIFIQKLSFSGGFHSYTYILGSIFLIVSISLFFVEILKSDKILYFKTYLMFWLSIGLFLFHTAILPLMVIINVLQTGVSHFNTIFFTLNMMMYSCFTIGFVISREYKD